MALKAHKLRQAAELREAIAAGAELRDRRGRRLVSLSPASIRKLVDCLGAILDDAVEDDLIARNATVNLLTSAQVAARLEAGMRSSEIAAELELEKSPSGTVQADAQRAVSGVLKLVRVVCP